MARQYYVRRLAWNTRTGSAFEAALEALVDPAGIPFRGQAPGDFWTVQLNSRNQRARQGMTLRLVGEGEYPLV